MSDKDRGSISLEAAMVVPMFIMLMLMVNGFFLLFMGQEIMSHALIQSAKSMAFDPYAVQRIDAEENDLSEFINDMGTLVTDGLQHNLTDWYEDEATVVTEAEKRFVSFVREDKNDANELLELVGIKDGIDGLDFAESEVDMDNGFLRLKVNYTQEFMFNLFDFTSIERSMCIKVKLFQYK